MAMPRAKAAEKAKKDLSGVMQTQISLPFISAENWSCAFRININKS